MERDYGKNTALRVRIHLSKIDISLGGFTAKVRVLAASEGETNFMTRERGGTQCIGSYGIACSRDESSVIGRVIIRIDHL